MKVKTEPELSLFMAELTAALTGKDDDEIAAAVEAASMDDVLSLDGPTACAWSAQEAAKEKDVPVVSRKIEIGSKGYAFLGSARGTKEAVDLFTRRKIVGDERGWLMSTNASTLTNSVGPPSAGVCRTAASFP